MPHASRDSHDPTTPRAVAELQPWFHNLHLPDGTQTAPDHPLGDFPAYKWQELAATLPEDLHGWKALDIGCNAGYYSFELARRGAEVVAIDSNPHYLRQARWAAEQYGLNERIRFRQQQVYDLARDAAHYDLVLFLGVLYHLRYPLLGLDIVCEKTRGLLCLQSLTMPGMEVAGDTDGHGFAQRDRMLEPGWPKMAFIEGRFADDPTNWWAPNHACLEAMLRSCGMRVASRPGHELYVCTAEPAFDACVRSWNRQEYVAALGLEEQDARGPDAPANDH